MGSYAPLWFLWDDRSLCKSVSCFKSVWVVRKSTGICTSRWSPGWHQLTRHTLEPGLITTQPVCVPTRLSVGLRGLYVVCEYLCTIWVGDQARTINSLITDGASSTIWPPSHPATCIWHHHDCYHVTASCSAWCLTFRSHVTIQFSIIIGIGQRCGPAVVVHIWQLPWWNFVVLTMRRLHYSGCLKSAANYRMRIFIYTGWALKLFLHRCPVTEVVASRVQIDQIWK